MTDEQTMRPPAMMTAAYVLKNGPADDIAFGELPTPPLGSTDVLVRMQASAVNHVDLLVRSGAFATHTPFPFVIGRDLVGMVVEAGEGVSDAFAAGRIVWSNSLGHDGRQGAFSEYVAVPADRLYFMPAGVDAVQAVCVLHGAATAYIGLFRDAQLRLGETVFVAGAAGSVGSAVVQLAHEAGARVIATASPRDHDWCRDIGADTVLDYHDRKLNEAIGDAAPAGIDVWWDTSGRNDLAAALPLLRRGGRVVMMAGLTAQARLTAGDLYTRDLSIRGFAISNASVTDLADAARIINHFLRRGRLRGRVGTVLSLAQSRDAHRLMESGGCSGRIIVVPRQAWKARCRVANGL